MYRNGRKVVGAPGFEPLSVSEQYRMDESIVERLMSHVKTYPEGKPMFRSYPPEALVVEAAEEIRRLRKALLEMQGAAALALTIVPETGQVADLFASIHRHCASALSSGKSPVNEERQALDPRP